MNSTTASCDCEKILDAKVNAPTDYENTTTHKHLHIDDYVSMHVKTEREVTSSINPISFNSIYHSKPSIGFGVKLEKPPQS